AGISAKHKHFEQFMRELAAMGFGQMQGVRRRLVVTQIADLLGVTARDVEQAIPAVRHRAADDRAPAADHQAEAAPAPLGQAAPPARRRAEYNLLSVTLYEPSLANEPIQGDAAEALPLAAMFTADDFVDP